ncbi:MAG TPA: DinB family protein [Candidatus Sulfotelmatobacter sp.]|nr:DinB family protein [Candidatus Sulfotelmatobacter sp.]
MSTGNAQMLNQSLPGDLQSILNELDRTDQEARQIVSGLSEAQLNWQPSGTAWSVAQCLDHLGQINSIYTRALCTAVRQASINAGVPRKPIHPGWFGRWFVNAIEPPPRKKIKSPLKGRPAAHMSGEEVLSAFVAAHNELRALIHEARELDLNRIRFKNPFISVLRFTVGTGMLIIGAHDRRHLWQARQVCAAMKPLSVQKISS